MKILWVVNMVLPNAAKDLGLTTSFSGGWLVDYAEKLANDADIQLATMTYANVKEPIIKTVGGIKYYILPGGGKRLLFSSKKTTKDCKFVLDDFAPDIIHLHGTEYSMAYSMVKLGCKTPILLTIQGILTKISKEYQGGLSTKDFYTATTFKQLLRLKSPVFMKQLYLNNAKRERYVIKNVTRVTGRTLWDKGAMKSINPNLKYYRLNYNLRPEFYDAQKWDYGKMTPHTVYTGAASYSLKGLHILIRALGIVKNRFSDVKLFVTGNSVTYKQSNGYERYIRKLIKSLNLEDNVEFVGVKSAQGVVELLQKSNVCVVPSAMEGASATLCESMMIGTPSISSFRGGMTDLLKDGESGFYYDFPEYSVLAERICQLFEDKDLCLKFSINTVVDATKRHSREENFNTLKNIYLEIIKEENNEKQ